MGLEAKNYYRRSDWPEIEVLGLIGADIPESISRSDTQGDRRYYLGFNTWPNIIPL